MTTSAFIQFSFPSISIIDCARPHSQPAVSVVDLPPPDINVEHVPSGDGTKHGISVTARRDGGKTRTWSGEGNSVNDAVKGVVEKIFADPMSREFQK